MKLYPIHWKKRWSHNLYTRITFVSQLESVNLELEQGDLMRACISRYLFSNDVNGLSFTITSRDEPATIGKPMWYTSVSGLRTNFFWPLELITCSHILVSDSSALHVSCGSHWGAHVGVTYMAWFLRVPSSPPDVTNRWFGWRFRLILSRKNLERKQTRLRLHFLQLSTFSLHLGGMTKSLVNSVQWCSDGTGWSWSRRCRSKYFGFCTWHSGSSKNKCTSLELFLKSGRRCCLSKNSAYSPMLWCALHGVILIRNMPSIIVASGPHPAGRAVLTFVLWHFRTFFQHFCCVCFCTLYRVTLRGCYCSWEFNALFVCRVHLCFGAGSVCNSLLPTFNLKLPFFFNIGYFLTSRFPLCEHE